MPPPEGAPGLTEAGAVAGGAVGVTGVGVAGAALGEVDAACTCAATGAGPPAEAGADAAVITPAGGLEAGGELGVGVAEGEGVEPRVARGGYH